MLICNAYIPPNLSRSTNETIRCFLIDTIDTALLERPNSWVLICGDLNQAFIDQELTPLMDSLDLTNVVDCNTTKNSMLDVFLVPASMALGYRPVTCSAPLGNSDHFVCHLSPNDEEPMEFASHPIYDLRASRVSGFVNTLSTVNFHQLYHASNIDTKVNLLYEAINFAMKEIPVNQVSVSDSDPPWISNVVLDIARKKQQAFAANNFTLHKHLSHKLAKAVINAKRRCLLNADTAKDSWELYRGFTAGRSSAPLRQVIKDFGSTGTALNAIGEVFARSMSGSSTISQPNADDDVDIDDPVMNIDSIEVYNYLSSVKVSGTGADGIPNKLYKCAAHILADPICNIVNTYLLTGQVPTLFKHATISPIPKKHNATINDLRPISLLSVPSKCLEFCVLRFLRPLISTLSSSPIKRASLPAPRSCLSSTMVTQILDSGDLVLLQL